jgi:hypothetical protein
MTKENGPGIGDPQPTTNTSKAWSDSPLLTNRQKFRKSRGGKRSRDKGQRTELFVKHALQAHGISATKVSRMYQPGHDITARVAGRDLQLEVKSRAQGFGTLYKFLEQRDVLVVKADRQEPLVIVRLSLAAEIAAAAEQGRS